MYNTDEQGRPSPGAPADKWGDSDHPHVCTVCFTLRATIDKSIYWKKLHDDWNGNRTNTNKLKPGGDYFAS